VYIREEHGTGGGAGETSTVPIIKIIIIIIK
jgi:hypothetical protein